MRMPRRLALLLGLAATIAPLPSAARVSGEAEAIRALLDCQARDWNRGDLDAFLDGYWRSPRVVFQSGGKRSEGWEATRDRYRTRYQGEGREMGKLAFRDLEVEVFGLDAAFARGRWELTLADGKRPGGLFTLVLRKLPEGWRIVHDHTSSDAE